MCKKCKNCKCKKQSTLLEQGGFALCIFDTMANPLKMLTLESGFYQIPGFFILEVAMFKIGCDPEFIFRGSNGYLVEANTILADGDFGRDGHASTGELRPKAAGNSLQLVANIKRLIEDGMEHDEIKDLDMLAGHYKLGKPIGGHIHLSGFSMMFENLTGYLKKTLMTLSDCIDEISERDRRASAGYGTGEGGSGYRRQNDDWIEFRIPGSWLLSPQTAFVNLWLAEATSYAYMNKNQEAFDKLHLHGGCDGIMRFALHMEDVPHQDIFLKVADKVFGHLPLDWSMDIKKYWVQGHKTERRDYEI